MARQRAIGARAFSKTAPRWKEEEDEDEPEQPLPTRPSKLRAYVREGMTPLELRQINEVAQREGHASLDAQLQAEITDSLEVSKDAMALDEAFDAVDKGPKPNKDSFWFDEEDEEDPSTEDIEEFDEDDITSMAHGKLEEIRDMRHYQRLAVWEMPLLASRCRKPP